MESAPFYQNHRTIFYVFVSWTKVYCFYYHIATGSSAGSVVPHLFTWKMDLLIFPDALGLLWQVDMYIQTFSCALSHFHVTSPRVTLSINFFFLAPSPIFLICLLILSVQNQILFIISFGKNDQAANKIVLFLSEVFVLMYLRSLILLAVMYLVC